MGGPAGIEPGYGPFYNWERDDEDERDDEELVICEECGHRTEALTHGLCTSCEVKRYDEDAKRREDEVRRGK